MANKVAFASPNKELPGLNCSTHVATSLPPWSLPSTTTDVFPSLIAASKFNFIQFGGGGIHVLSLEEFLL